MLVSQRALLLHDAIIAVVTLYDNNQPVLEVQVASEANFQR